MFVLDTNVVAALRLRKMAPRSLVRWAHHTPVEQMYLSAVTLLELEIGTLSMERKDPLQGRVMRSWLEGFLIPRFSGRILPVDGTVAWRCAALHLPDPRAERDAMIAATAIVHDMTIVTRNVSDFNGTGARLINPWDL